LLRCSRACEAGGDRDLALDLASWMGGAAQSLAPHAFIDPTVRTLVRECLEWHAHLLAAGGDAAGAERAAATARIFEDPDQ